MIKVVLWLLPEIGNLVKTIGAAIFGVLFMGAITVGTNVQPWSQWWITTPGATVISPNPGSNFPVFGNVTDSGRYQLALMAGFPPADAIVMTAISIAENGSGSPTALSSTMDIGIWQINEVHWARFGGREALTNPMTNAQAAKYVAEIQGPCAWYTYDSACGPHHTSAYKMFLDRARAAASVQPPHGPLQQDWPALTREVNAWFDVRYVFGGCSKAGVDCSCMTQDIMRKLGVDLPRTAEEQYRASKRVSSPQIGDLVFFERTYNGPWITHVGIYMGDGIMVSAIEPRVGRQNLGDPYWVSRLVGYGRLNFPLPGNQA